jgi:putative ABC transport system substrate-binding protein
MRRRDFISVLGGVAATWPLAAHAQQPARMARLGYLAPASISHLIEALRGGLRDLGYVEGQNLAIEYRFALGQSKTYDELAAELVSLSPDAIVVVGTPPALAAKRQTTSIPVIMAPTAHRLPTMYEAREFVEDGGLISYGPNITDLSRRAAAFVVKVLNGAKPADLPIEQPTRFQLVINLKTAKALGLDIPSTLLARADEVIE